MTATTPDPYTADEFAELIEDDIEAAIHASDRELAAEFNMTVPEWAAFCATEVN